MNMKKAYLLTGEPRIGKSSMIKHIIDALGGEHCGGFYTEEIHEEERFQDKRVGFRLVTLEGREGILAHVNSESPLRMGRYGVNVDCLDAVGMPALYRAMEAKKLIVLDEIGPMQACSDDFKRTVTSILENAHLLLGTISLDSHPWLDTMKRHKNVVLYELTLDNSESIMNKLTDLLRANLSKSRG